MSLVLYHGPLCPGSERVRLLLEDRELRWTGDVIDLSRKQNLEPVYLAINPRGLVPTLVADDQVIVEASVICEFLEDYSDVNPRMPRDAFARARVREWTKYVDEFMHFVTGPILFATLGRLSWQTTSEAQREAWLSATPDPARAAAQRSLFAHGLDAPELESALDIWSRTLPLLEQQLRDQAWLVAGDQPSLADFAMVPHVFALEYMRFDGALARHPSVQAWLARLEARPSFERAYDPFLSEASWQGIAHVAGMVGPGLDARLLARWP